jgi:catechol 2,3-dioxygenase
MMPEPCRDLAHIGPIELRTPVLEDSARFFVDQMGLSVVERTADSILVRTWDDYQRFTIRLVRAAQPGIGRTYLRTSSEAALDRRVNAVEMTGLGGTWVEPADGLGRVFVFDGPGGHAFGLYADVAWHRPAPGEKPALKNQASPFPGRGANLRRLDHVNFLSPDVSSDSAFAAQVLGARPTEQIVLDDGSLSAIWYHVTDKSYDLVWTSDWTGSSARLHHVAFAVDTRDDILRAADVCLEAGVHIETGPHKHAVQQTFFLYVWEPGGNRIELCNAGARLVLAPDWPLVTWTEAERARGQAWGLRTIETFHTHGTPPVPAREDSGD